jgi:signal recognition particle receptor subunit beta
MAEFGRDGAEVKARIVFWGIEGSGKSTNLQVIHSKLRPDNRGELRKLPTRLDPTVSYETLPIELGQVGGVRTRIQIIALPGAPEHAPTRKQLLDRVDGIVFVVDTQPDRTQENLSSLEELREALSSYGYALEDVPLVVQYNKRDKSDPFALEELHRKLSMRSVAAFEAVATSGTGVLQTLTTISKRVIRHLRERDPGERNLEAGEEATPSEPEPQQPEVSPPAGASQILETVVSTPALPEAPLDEGIDQTAAIDPATLYDPDDPDGAAIDATTAAAEALFEPSFRQVTLEMESSGGSGQEPNAPAPLGRIHLESVGEAIQTGSRTLKIPVVLRDDAGRSLALSLSVELEANDMESGD